MQSNKREHNKAKYTTNLAVWLYFKILWRS